MEKMSADFIMKLAIEAGNKARESGISDEDSIKLAAITVYCVLIDWGMNEENAQKVSEIIKNSLTIVYE